ncbi:MAG TPA: cytochrome c biogenesis protein CcdA [Anaerolineales bacterium]
MAENIPQNHPFIWCVLLILGVLMLALAGYLGFVVYPRFDLPSVTGSGLLILATMAGVASFFSPCSFPLLLTLLAREVREDNREKRVSLGRPLSFAAALSAGATLFLILAGAAIALGGGPLFAQVTFASLSGQIIRLIIGALLILLGLIQLGSIPISFHGVENLVQPLLKYQAQLHREHPILAFAVFGFGYLIAGFG